MIKQDISSFYISMNFFIAMEIKNTLQFYKVTKKIKVNLRELAIKYLQFTFHLI